MTTSRNTFLAAALLLAVPAALPGDAMAQSYPRVTGTGENMMVDYGPMGQGSLVGGGRVMVSEPGGMEVRILHLDAMFSQTPRDGFIPVTIGSGESTETIYVPANMMEMFRRARGNPSR
ncbi:hypothetical protein [Falsiroseomonas sp. E2-1-a20]|uniref:hypothetical protein n=1 Tax=Falsiroseomonas sp. E2-1-a20 TaxID=3239300 RepID=UPI003F371765